MSVILDEIVRSTISVLSASGSGLVSGRKGRRKFWYRSRTTWFFYFLRCQSPKNRNKKGLEICLPGR